jgi:hypothetical protein
MLPSVTCNTAIILDGLGACTQARVHLLHRRRFTNEFCVVANASELDVNNTLGTFGWADTKCSTLAPHMCRISRKCPPASAAGNCMHLPCMLAM